MVLVSQNDLRTGELRRQGLKHMISLESWMEQSECHALFNRLMKHSPAKLRVAAAVSLRPANVGAFPGKP
jgi:hypothetical protein